jgi:S-DNA-T family DNA segregation ATPase FtsK/SpoIIIE
MFEFLPAAGVKVSRIASLSDDLAMAMEALRVRIVAPIPGKGVVGIEVPNKQRQSVVLKELVEQEAFQKSPSKLAMCLGKDIEGMPYIADLARMPHLLIAGTTGSGKSVAVNSMIISMLLRASPEEVRFLMVDPKMLELSVYEGIPHLLLPVVTDSKKAAMALRWAVEEMERRYQLLADCGVRNIGSYNKKVEKDGDFARKRQKHVGKEKRVVDLTDPTLDAHELQRLAANGELTAVRAQIGLRPTVPEDAGERVGAGAMQAPFLSDGPAGRHGGAALTRGAAANGAGATAQSGAEWLLAEMHARGEPVELAGKQAELPLEPLRKLPYLVIIIDELADLMMVASREVETYIARLAQMARAAGIHLMVATQRPSTDVVTGVIKANFPARISFQVASRHDSATIINTPGAENLLGMGDMLILPPGTNTLTRVHGPYVDEKEIHAVVEHWKAQGSPVYDPNILKPRVEDGEGEGGLPDEGPDELYDQAIASLGEMRFISISLLQRKLRVGYNRAARMIERMEKDGIVGPADGAKPREVLIRALGEMPGAGT